jgi:hypothetical protein
VGAVAGGEVTSSSDVRTFVKLPAAFTIPTPLGDYNPDWAVVVERADGSRYLVVETKGSINPELLRPAEKGKISAAERPFSTIQVSLDIDDLRYAKVDGMGAADGVIDESTPEVLQFRVVGPAGRYRCRTAGPIITAHLGQTRPTDSGAGAAGAVRGCADRLARMATVRGGR